MKVPRTGDSATVLPWVSASELSRNEPSASMDLSVDGITHHFMAPIGRGYNAQFRPQLRPPKLRGIGIKEVLLDTAAATDPLSRLIGRTASTSVCREIVCQNRFAEFKPQAVWVTPTSHVLIANPLMDGNMESLIRYFEPRSARVAAWLMLASVAATLARCHAEGYVHRDIKLDNILWRADGTLSLSDFGSMSHVGDDGYLHDAHGIFCWLAPEMILAGTYSSPLTSGHSALLWASWWRLHAGRGKDRFSH